jgi:tetratricopeptide (TPR) repeat protein
MKTLKTNLSNSILLALFITLAAAFYIKIPQKQIYPPLFSKKFPLSTPVSFWASALGMRRLAADIVWIQTMQYYGTRQKSGTSELLFNKDKKKSLSYPELKGYWQQIIRFDPLFINVYLVGPTTLGWNLKRYGEAMELIDEGIKVIEDIDITFKNLNIKEIDEIHPLILGKMSYFEEVKWKLYTLKSALIYLHQKKFEKAVSLLEKIAFKDDTPEEIKIMLAQIYESKNDYVKSLALWIKVFETTNDEERKLRAFNNVNRLKNFIASL